MPTSNGTPVFKRAALAVRVADTVLQNAPGSAAASGVFLAAPRRTGKSTFLREDLRPELQSRHVLDLYVDLWADRGADPGEVIVSAVRAELSRHEGVVSRLAKSAGMEKVAVGGMSFSLDRVGLGAQVSLSAALSALSDEIRKPIVLVVDEAQHAITTEKGYEALFALKAARDELNSSRHHGLRIVATGSNRDKLAMLRNNRDQAFYQAPLLPFPHLDSSYVAWFCAGVGLPAPLDPAEVMTLFEAASYRPEILGAAADTVRFENALDSATTTSPVDSADVSRRFRAAVEQQVRDADIENLRVVRSLTPLQTTVLRVLAADGKAFAPFEPPTLDAYRRVLQSIQGDSGARQAQLETPSVQSALTALQEKALVWRERRGMYALEESSLADLLKSEGMLDGVPPLSARSRK